VRAALFQPDIAANAAAAMRLAACLDVPLVIIEPCGFIWDQRRLRRVGLDYIGQVELTRFASFSAFETWRQGAGARLVLLTTRAEQAHHTVRYRPDDVLLAGRESAGAPEMVHVAADLRVRVPMAPDRRSLNLVTALAIVLGEALRQTGGFALPAPP
jgi:tRNA (cytidine/uridine-2'-O-)-methyltransferase